AALLVTLLMMPAFAHWLFSIKARKDKYKHYLNILLIIIGFISLWWIAWGGIVLILLGINGMIYHLYKNSTTPYFIFFKDIKDERLLSFFNLMVKYHDAITIGIITAAVSWLLSGEWLPLGVENSLIFNFLFIIFIIAVVLGVFK